MVVHLPSMNPEISKAESYRLQTSTRLKELDASGSLHSSGRIFEEERNENVVSLSSTDANVLDPKSSGSIILYSSGSMDYDWSKSTKSTRKESNTFKILRM